MGSEKKITKEITEEMREAERILERVQQDSETVGTSSLKRVADRVKDHVNPGDIHKDENQWAELWGTRIGRSLGVLFFIGLVVYLFKTYIFNV